MTSDESPNGTLQRFFAGMSEYIFHSKLGVADTEMVDYLSDLLVRFTKTDAMHRIRQLNGRPATEVFSMMVEAQQRIGQAKRDIHRQSEISLSSGRECIPRVVERDSIVRLARPLCQLLSSREASLRDC